MTIDKVPGLDSLAPVPKPEPTRKTPSGEFDRTLKETVASQKAKTPSSATASASETADKEKLQQVQSRIQSGFYHRQDIVEITAEKILKQRSQK